MRYMTPFRPAVGSTHAWSVARADMEALPEARWRPEPFTKEAHWIADGTHCFFSPLIGRDKHWEGVKPEQYAWLRLADAT